MAAACATRWRHLDDVDRERLVEQARTLDRTRFWESVDDLPVTASMRAVVACHACLLTVNLGLGYLSDVTSIILAPTSVTKTTRHRDGAVVSEGVACILGESMLHGPVRIAWDRVVAESDGEATTSVIIHEFAHKIDMADGSSDGLPPLGSRPAAQAFARTLDGTLRSIRAGAIETPMRLYAATNRQELFAVATEAFFLESAALREANPDVYDVLSRFYRQDPGRTSRAG